MTNRATAQGLYRALQSKVGRISAEIETAMKENGGIFTPELEKKKAYLESMQKAGVK
jgi:hypothetical protein